VHGVASTNLSLNPFKALIGKIELVPNNTAFSRPVDSVPKRVNSQMAGSDLVSEYLRELTLAPGFSYAIRLLTKRTDGWSYGSVAGKCERHASISLLCRLVTVSRVVLLFSRGDFRGAGLFAGLYRPSIISRNRASSSVVVLTLCRTAG